MSILTRKKDDIGAFVVPNAVMLIRGAPHQKAAKKADRLSAQQRDRKRSLLLQIVHKYRYIRDVAMPKELKPIDQIKVMQVDYSKIAKKLIEIQPWLKTWMTTR